MSDSTVQPSNILRGHKAQIHAASFIRNNDRLVTGDADGFVVVWSLAIMRPVAVWKAHDSALLGIQGWGSDKLITHGRDHKLIVWKLNEECEKDLSSDPPLEETGQSRPNPWIVHILDVNAMNFCPFAACPASSSIGSIHNSSEILLAVPNALVSESVDIFHLPSQNRVHTITSEHKNGMAMGLSLIHKDGKLVLIAGFENGYTSVYVLNETDGAWTMTYRNQAHSQPVLSLDVHPGCGFYVTSSADASITKHPIPLARREVLLPLGAGGQASAAPHPSAGLSEAFAQISASQNAPKSVPGKEWEDAIKVINTKHSGQQSLTVRSDGKIFATAGWDSNIRVYSCKTLKELAVLQWHKVGVYAVSLAEIRIPSVEVTASEALAGSCSALTSLTVKERRLQMAKEAHWLAAGSKDGKVTLWNIY